jgi:hypothetical protein
MTIKRPPQSYTYIEMQTSIESAMKIDQLFDKFE